jgi:hypothetical protein
MATATADKIGQTQSSFPAQKPGAVAECPFKAKPVEESPAPIATKTAYQMTQGKAKTSEAMSQAAAPQKEKKDWIEIILVDMDGKPVPGVRYKITPSGGMPPQEGRLNEHGQAGYYKIEAGSCKITFPDLDKDAWE